MKRIPIIVLALALVSLIGCSSSSAPGVITTPKMVTVNVLDFSYDLKSIQINRGDTVRWVLVGADTTHTVTEVNGVFDSGMIFLQQGDTYDRVFNQNNLTFNYSCTSHKACCAMQGSIQVGSQAPPPIPGY